MDINGPRWAGWIFMFLASLGCSGLFLVVLLPGDSPIPIRPDHQLPVAVIPIRHPKPESPL